MPTKYSLVASALRQELTQHMGDTHYHLPTEMELCRTYQVSRQTVRQALSILEDEGLIIRRQGSGTYPAPAPVANRTAAVILPDSQTYIYPTMIRDIQAFFYSHGYSVQVFTTDGLLEREREILESLLQSPVTALLVKGVRTAWPNPNLELYTQLEKHGTHLAFFDGCYPGLSCGIQVSGDNWEGGFALASYLISQKHQRIAGIFRQDDLESQERYLGCAAAILNHRLPLKDSWFYWYTTAPYGYFAEHVSSLGLSPQFLDCLSRECSAVICHNDETAYHLIQALTKEGISVPEEISVVSFDNSYLCQLSPIRITSMSHNQLKTWSTAAELLLQKIQGYPAESVKLSWHMEKRDSDQKPPSHYKF